MADKRKLADIPLARPGFDALDISAPIMVQVNPNGSWEKHPPNNLDEKRLKAIVQYLVNSNAVTAAKSYCEQCCAESKRSGGSGAPSNYVPVIMMPIYPADECPFDVKCAIKKMEESKTEKHVKKGETHKTEEAKDSAASHKKKKRGYVLQRFTNFDFLSQW